MNTPGSTENVTLITTEIERPDSLEQGHATVSIWVVKAPNAQNWHVTFHEVTGNGSQSRPIGELSIPLVRAEPGELEAAPALARLDAFLAAWCQAGNIGGVAEADWGVAPPPFHGGEVRVNLELTPGGTFSGVRGQ